MKNRVKTQEGFSLIELLAVIAIIVVIASIAIPSYIGARRAARENLDIIKLANIGAAANTFKRSMGQYRYPYLGELNDALPGQTAPLCAITEDGSSIGLTATSVVNEYHKFESLETPAATTFSVWIIPLKNGQIDYSRPTYAVYEDGRVRTNNQPYPNVPSRSSPAVNK